MSLEPELYNLFLAEIEALERYRARHLSHYPSTPLSRDDPDVSRIIEALALFSARTRELARRNVVDMSARLFRQHFAYLLDPIPASARVQALPSRGFADMVEIPRATSMHLSKEVAPVDAPARRYDLAYRTLGPIRVLPLGVDRVDLDSRRKGAHRVEIQISAIQERHDDLRELTLDIDHLSDFHASLNVFHTLRDRVRRAWARFDGRGGRDFAEADEVRLRFGSREPAVDELKLFDRPLLHTRVFFQNPWVELRFTAELPRPPSAWRKLSLFLELDEWPGELALRSDTFCLNATPVMNFNRQMAAPIDCDGTQDRYLVRHPDPKAGMVPFSISGVYRATPDGLMPMPPAALTGGEGTYEVSIEGKGSERRVWVSADLPGAFEKPERLSVEAHWHQPLTGLLGTGGYEVHLSDRFLSSVAWRLLGEVAPEAEGVQEQDAEALLRLLAVKNKSVLDREDLLFLLEVLGAFRSRYYQGVMGSLKELKVRTEPYSRGGMSGLKTIYHAVFRGLEEVAIPRLALFAPHLHALLESWCEDDVIELRITAPELGFDREYGLHAMNGGAGTGAAGVRPAGEGRTR